MRNIVGFFLVLGYVLVTVQLAYAQESTPFPVTDNQVNAIAKQLYCPVCENIPLDVCPTKACSEWRELIRDLLSEGKTEAEIKDYFVRQYGDRVLGAPPARGINWLIYLIPPVAILAGCYVLFRVFKEWHMPAKIGSALDASGADSVPDDTANGDTAKYVTRLEEELRKR